MTTFNGRTWNQVDQSNPRVWQLFERFANEMRGRHFQHYSAYAVMHRVRWETAAVLSDGGDYKISNGWIPFYARKYNRAHSFEFFIERRAAADKWFPPLNAADAA